MNLETDMEDLKAALTDMLAGWRYIRRHHGDLYGVGWDRCETSAEAALAKADAILARGAGEAGGVTDAMVKAALYARVPGGAEVCAWLPQKDAWTPHQTAYDVMRCALEAALIASPAPRKDPAGEEANARALLAEAVEVMEPPEGAIRITIVATNDPEAPIHTRVQGNAIAERDVRPTLDRAIGALQAERYALETCPYHGSAQ